jgi:hypothetical protein
MGCKILWWWSADKDDAYIYMLESKASSFPHFFTTLATWVR